MKGELLPIWSRTWTEIWRPALESNDFGIQLAEELAAKYPPHRPKSPGRLSPQAYDESGKVIDREALAAQADFQTNLERFKELETQRQNALDEVEGESPKERFVRLRGWLQKNSVSNPRVERDALETIHYAFKACVDAGETEFATAFATRVRRFVEFYNLRYLVTLDCRLQPSLAGIFSALIVETRAICTDENGLRSHIDDFDEAVADLRNGATPGRVRTCIHKQFNLLEALGKLSILRGESPKDAYKQILRGNGGYPHPSIERILQELFNLRSDAPGIAHGKPKSGKLAKMVLRDFEMKDAIAVSVLMAGTIPYFIKQLDANQIYEC